MSDNNNSLGVPLSPSGIIIKFQCDANHNHKKISKISDIIIKFQCDANHNHKKISKISDKKKGMCIIFVLVLL